MLKRLRPSLSKIIPITVIFLLAFTYRDVLRSMVLVPLAYLIFIFRLIASSIGQQTLWISFVVLSSIIAVISLVMHREEQTEEPSVEHKYGSPQRTQRLFQMEPGTGSQQSICRGHRLSFRPFPQ